MERKYLIASLLLLLALAFVARVHPLTIDAFPGSDPYFHTRMSEKIVDEQAVPKYDELSQQGRNYTYSPLYHLSFASFSIFSGVDSYVLTRLYPAIYGAMCVLVAFIFTRKFFGEKAGLFAALAISVMPIHLARTASYARPDGLALFIIPVVLYLIYERRYLPAAIISIALVMLHPFSMAYLLALLVILILVMKVKHYSSSIVNVKVFAIIILSLVIYALWLISQQTPLTYYLSNTAMESMEMASLSLSGIIFFFTFSWLFVIIALTKMKENLFLKSWLLFSVVFAVIGLRAAIFMSVPFAIFAGFGLEFIMEKLEQHKKAVFALIILLACATLLPRIYQQGSFVSDAEESAMEWLKLNSEEDATIACLWDRGHPLTYITGKKVLMDGYFEFGGDLNERKDAMRDLILSSDCDRIAQNVQKFNINYFFVHQKGLENRQYQTGMLEATTCSNIGSVFASDSARIFKYS